MPKLAIETAIIVAFITLMGTIVTAIGKQLLDRIWPEKKEDE